MSSTMFTEAIAEASGMKLEDICTTPEVLFVSPDIASVPVERLPIRTLDGMKSVYSLLDVQPEGKG